MHAKKNGDGDIVIRRALSEKIIILLVLAGVTGSLGTSIATKQQISTSDSTQNERLGILEERTKNLNQMAETVNEINLLVGRIDERTKQMQSNRGTP